MSQLFEDIITQKEIKFFLDYVDNAESKKNIAITNTRTHTIITPNLSKHVLYKELIFNILKKVGVKASLSNWSVSKVWDSLGIHTDVTKNDYLMYRQIIVPLEIQEQASTIVFNNTVSSYKSNFYLNKENKKEVNNLTDQSFSKDIYNKYLSNFDYSLLHGLSVQTIFDWKVGSVFVYDAKYLHVNGPSQLKKAINIFTMK